MYGYSDYGYYSGGFTTAITIIYLLIAVISIVTMWKIFTKAGKPGWASIVPIYNIYVLFEITWGKGIKFLLLLIPIVNIVIGIMTYSKLSKSFGKGMGFTLGLLFLFPIFMLLLAFDSSQYIGPSGAVAAGGYNSYSPPPGPGYPPQGNVYPTQQSGYLHPTNTTTQPIAIDNSWQCDCGKMSSGKFCAECGKEKPIIAPPSPLEQPANNNWLCSCGQSNKGMFCPTCGSKKNTQPTNGSWLCSCGRNNTGGFCPACGARKR